MFFSQITNFRNKGVISGCQGLVTRGRKGGCAYKKATESVLGLMELLSSSTTVVSAQTHTCDKVA